MRQQNTYREKGTFLAAIDEHFNPFALPQIKKNTVFFIYGEKIEKAFYYNNRYPNVNLPKLLQVHFRGYFDIVARFGAVVTNGGTRALSFLNGREKYLDLTARSRNPSTASAEPAPPTNMSSHHPGMNALRSRLRDRYNNAIERAQPVAEERELFHENRPEIMIDEFDTRIFVNGQYPTLLICDGFTDWIHLLIQNERAVGQLKRWCSDEGGFRETRHMVVFLMKDDFITSQFQTNPDGYHQRLPQTLETLHRELATGGNVFSIPLHNHTKTEIEKFLTLQSINASLPFEAADIPEIATTLSAAAANQDYENQRTSDFRSRTFDIEELRVELLHTSGSWESYYSSARTLANLKDFGNRLSGQIYHPGVIERLLEWLENAVLAIIDTEQPPIFKNLYLYGPPGTGKTSFVKALVSEFNFSLVDDKYVSQWVGGGATNIGNTFTKARELFASSRRPVVIFQDEFGRLKSANDGLSHDRANQEMIEQFKEELESTKGTNGIFFIAGANSGKIDEALDDRFSGQILIPLPGPTENYRLIKHLFPIDAFQSLDVLGLANFLYEHRYSQRNVVELAYKLRAKARRSGNMLDTLDIHREMREKNREQYDFEQQTLQAYPDIGVFRDPAQDEIYIQQRIKETTDFIVEQLAILEQ